MFYRQALELLAPEDAERRREVRRRLAVAQQAYVHLMDVRLLGLGGENRER